MRRFVTARPEERRPGRHFIAVAGSPPESLVPTVIARTWEEACRLGTGGISLVWDDPHEDLVVGITDRGARVVVGRVDWVGHLTHGRLWAGFTPSELGEFGRAWESMLLFRRDPREWSRRHATGWEGFEDEGPLA